MTTNEERLLAGLKALANSETRVPSALLEAKIFAQLRPARRIYFRSAAFLALAAALVIAAMFRPAPAFKTAVTFNSEVPRRIDEELPAREIQRSATAPKLRLRGLARAAAKTADIQLIRIPYAADLQPTDRVELLRVNMPAAQLLFWGFPISGTDPNQRVDTDVLVGQDGLARAVRVVQIGETK